MKSEIIDDINRSLTKSDYDSFLVSVVEKFGKYDECLGIGKFGTINSPGISDIDLLFVLNDDQENNLDALIKSYEEDLTKIPHHGYLMWHEAIFILQKELQYLDLFHSVSNLEFIYKKTDLFKHDLKVDEVRTLIWNSYFLQAYLETEKSKKVSLRYLLLILKNISYSLKFNHHIQAASFLNQVENIRAKCLTNSIDNSLKLELNNLFNEGMQLIREIENKQKENSFSLSIIKQEHSFYIPFPSVHFFQFRNYKIFLLPSVYFTLRKSLVDKNKAERNHAFNHYKSLLYSFLKNSKFSYENILRRTSSAAILDQTRIEIEK